MNRSRAHDDGRASTAVRPAAAARQNGMADLLFAMQRTAGNRAVRRMLSGELGAGPAGPLLQRLKVTSSQLGKETTAVTARGSSFNEIHAALEAYEKAEVKTAAADRSWTLFAKLTALDQQCLEWLRGHTAKGDQARRDLLLKLRAALAEERTALQRLIEGEMYMESISGKTSSPHGGTIYQPKALTDASRDKVVGGPSANESAALRAKREALISARNLTPADVASIKIFTSTAGDFNYINPAQVAPDADPTKDWLTKNRSDPKAAKWRNLPDATLRGEGQLHAQMAEGALAKLEPYDGVSYRGQSTASFTLKAGDTYTFQTLASTSKQHFVPVFFADNNVSRSSPIAVLWVLDHKGGHKPGRDVEYLAASYGEYEVMVSAGTSFKILEVAERGVDQVTGELADFEPHIKMMGTKLGKEPWSRIILVRAQMVPAA